MHSFGVLDDITIIQSSRKIGQLHVHIHIVCGDPHLPIYIILCTHIVVKHLLYNILG